jgi:hypothetical protein
MALAMITTSVFGSLGETPKQFEWRQPVKVENGGNGVMTMTWVGTRGIRTETFLNGVAIAESFQFNDRRKMTSADIEPFLKVFGRYTRSLATRANGVYSMMLTSPDGRNHVTVQYYYGDRRLFIAAVELFKTAEGLVEASAPITQPDLPMTHDEAEAFIEAEGAKVRAQNEQKQKRDCVLVAAENLRRLEPISFWAKTIHIVFVVDGKQVEVGHSVVAWKDKPGSNVKVIDSNGTLELQTIRPDLQAILAALEEAYSYNAKTKVKLLGRFDGDKEMQSSTGTNVNDPAYAIGYAIGSLMFLGILCTGFGLIGMAIGNGKGRRVAGFWLGFFLGGIGLIITACLKRKTPPLIPTGYATAG